MTMKVVSGAMGTWNNSLRVHGACPQSQVPVGLNQVVSSGNIHVVVGSIGCDVSIGEVSTALVCILNKSEISIVVPCRTKWVSGCLGETISHPIDSSINRRIIIYRWVEHGALATCRRNSSPGKLVVSGIAMKCTHCGTKARRGDITEERKEGDCDCLCWCVLVCVCVCVPMEWGVQLHVKYRPMHLPGGHKHVDGISVCRQISSGDETSNVVPHALWGQVAPSWVGGICHNVLQGHVSNTVGIINSPPGRTANTTAKSLDDAPGSWVHVAVHDEVKDCKRY